MVNGYYSTKDLCNRFRCSSRTIYRWIKREAIPFPLPRIKNPGSKNLWAIEDVDEWELRVSYKTPRNA